MSKFSKIMKVGIFAAFLAIVIAAPVMADYTDCIGPNKKYPDLSSDSNSTEYPIRCNPVTNDSGETIYLYGKTRNACAMAGTVVTNPEACSGNDLNTIVTTIINTVIFVVGMLAVVMIILGGINYATSQGDPSKVNKAKSTIMYGIIGLVICLLSYAIVSFILQSLA